MIKISQDYDTDRLIIRPTTVEDADLIFKLVNTPKWIKYIGDRNINSLKEAADYISLKAITQYKRLGYGNYTLILKKEGVKIGTCGLHDREGIDGVDIGFALLPKYEKKGLAFEAAKKVIEIGVKDFDIKKINAITTDQNIESKKLIKKLGFNFEKTINLPNDSKEMLLYIIRV